MARSKRNLKALQQRKKQQMTQLQVTEPTDLILSSDETTNNDFDYSSLDSDTARLAKESAIEIKAREKAIWEHIIWIGNRLIEMKRVLPHGKFMPWVSKEFGWSQRLAQQYMTIAEQINPNANYSSHLPNSMKALYQLAVSFSKVDEETKQEILDKVETQTKSKGSPLTESEVKDITNPYKEQLELEKKLHNALQLKFNNLQQTKDEVIKERNKLSIERQELDTKYQSVLNDKEILSQKIKEKEKELEEKEENLVKQYKKQLTQEIIDKETKDIKAKKEKLEASVKNLQDTEARLEAKIGILKELQDKSIRKILDDFKSIEKNLVSGKAALLLPPAPNLISEYKLTISHLRKWAELLEETLSNVTGTHTVDSNPIDVEVVNVDIDLTENT